METVAALAALIVGPLSSLIRPLTMWRLRGARGLPGYKPYREVFDQAATQLGLRYIEDTADQLAARNPQLDRLASSPLISNSFIRLHYSGSVDDVAVELLDWTNGQRRQQTIVVMPYAVPASAALHQPVVLTAGRPTGQSMLFRKLPKRPVTTFQGHLEPLNGYFSASHEQIVALLGNADILALMAEARRTAPFEVQFRMGELLFFQSLDDIKQHLSRHGLNKVDTVGGAIKSLKPTHDANRRSQWVEDTARRALRIRAALSADSGQQHL